MLWNQWFCFLIVYFFNKSGYSQFRNNIMKIVLLVFRKETHKTSLVLIDNKKGAKNTPSYINAMKHLSFRTRKAAKSKCGTSEFYAHVSLVCPRRSAPLDPWKKKSAHYI